MGFKDILEQYHKASDAIEKQKGVNASSRDLHGMYVLLLYVKTYFSQRSVIVRSNLTQKVYYNFATTFSQNPGLQSDSSCIGKAKYTGSCEITDDHGNKMDEMFEPDSEKDCKQDGRVR